ncbi:ABC transporter substrate-binding protein [Pelagibacterium montanilacus]|uniref:ABC transporter substrate-binding protein n=1 Tax=Pelagibacterium montanilacus TaxID=2185280 RepID=UPI0013DEED75|nr:ABC transporter substrate-binding protein [Pelagibacterium montanilacus]
MKHLKTLLIATALLSPSALYAQDLQTINVIKPLPRSANFYPLIAGEALGYFEEEGIEVNLLPSATSVPYVAFVQNGQADVAMLDHSEVINATAAGAGISVVYEVMQNAPEGIAVLGDSEVENVADLAGTTVGLVSDRDANTLAIALGTVDMTLDDVQTVIVGEAGPTLANALQNGSVSAIVGSVPDWLAVQAIGIDIKMISPPEISQVPANNFVISNARKDEIADIVEGFLRAWSKGMYVAEVDHGVVTEMAKRAVPEEWENEEFGQEFLDASIPMNVSITENAGDLQEGLWEEIQPRMQSVGAIDELIDPAEFLDNSFIEPANDWTREDVEADVAAWRESNM